MFPVFAAIYFIGFLFRFNALTHRRCRGCRAAQVFDLLGEALFWPATLVVDLLEGKAFGSFTYPHVARGLRCADCQQEVTQDAEAEWNFID